MSDTSEKYKLVLGLEVHIQPKTARKMFCGCDAAIWKSEPNSHTCPTCLGLPGALPVPNFEAVHKTHLLGLALNCKLNKNSKFDRKHYFYPDLPKGYQISQYKEPLCGEGYLNLDSGFKVEIERIHLEEDTAKSFHDENKTMLDFNKSGIPLIELVTKPCFREVLDASEFCKKIQVLVKTLGVSEADMEKGQMRLEANISLRTREMEERGELPKYKVEIKNINSFRFMEKAVKAEIERQSVLFEKGEAPVQENRGFNEATGKTVSQREKEEAHDYRYFPEPDIPPMEFDDKYFEELKKELPELPDEKKRRYIEKYGLSEASALKISVSDYIKVFDSVAAELNPVAVANVLINKPESRRWSKEKFREELNKKVDVISDEDTLKLVIKKVVESNPKAADDYEKGKKNAIQFLTGLVIRETKGKADPNITRNLIIKALK